MEDEFDQEDLRNLEAELKAMEHDDPELAQRAEKVKQRWDALVAAYPWLGER